VGTQAKIKISLPYQADSIRWQINALPGNPANVVTTYLVAPFFDSTTTVNNVTLYWYSLPNFYTFNTPGTFPVTITAYSPNSDGCGTEQEYDFEVEVHPKPTADFNFTTDGCVTNPVQFTDNSNTGGRPVFSRHWDFGDASTATILNPTHTYAAAGAYTVKYSLITDIGCKTDTATEVVTLNDPPLASFTTAGPYCEGNTISFTNTSSAGATTWNWDFGDGGTSTLQNPTHVYANAGTFTVTLVVSANTCQSLPYTFNVTVHPKPQSDFSFPNTICLPSGAAQFTDLSTVGAGNTITGWLWNFGDGSPTSNVQNPLHTYTGTGPYNASLTVTTNNGCTDQQQISVNTIYAEPQAAFNSLPSVCIGSLIGFSDMSTAPGSTVTGWNWDFGDGNTSSQQNPSHTYTAAGTYNVTLNVTSAVGCPTVNNSITHPVTVNPLPTASIAGNTTVCMNAPSPNITFTGAVGTPPFRFTYNINGGPNQLVTTTSGNSVTVPVPTTTAGTFTYNLLNVQEVSGSQCSQAQTGSVTVTVKALPTAAISGSTAVCLNGTAPVITFTGAAGVAPYTFTYNINGGAPQTVTTTSGNTVTITAPTGTAGTFQYNLVSVQEGSANLCAQPQTGTATVTVNPLPTASISGSTEVCVNAPSPSITFTGAAGTAPFRFTYTINGGANQTITTTSGNSVTLAVPTTAAGTFTYNLVSVQEVSGTQCQQAQTGSVTVTVNPLPTGDFTFSAPSCAEGAISFTDASVPNAGTLSNWQWDFGDPGSGANNTSTQQNPTHVFATAGTYNVKLTVSTTKGCVGTEIIKPVVIYARPQAAFSVPLVCRLDPAPFTDNSTVTGGSITAWQWNFGDPASGVNNTSAQQNPSHLYTAGGTFTAELIVTTNQGCKDTVQQTVNINGSAIIADFTVQNTGPVCSNREVTIQDDASVDFGTIQMVEVFWDYLNDPTIKTVDNTPVSGEIYTHAYPEFGAPLSKTVQIRYVVHTGGSCVGSSSQTITLLATPTLQFGTVPEICSNAADFQVTQAQLLNALPGSGVFSGTGISSTGLFSPAAAGAGQHIIRYTYTATYGCENYIEQTIGVNPTPGINAGPDKVVLEGGQVQLTPALSASAPVTYLWTPATGLDDPTAAMPYASPVADITYTVTVTTDKGCTASDQVFVKLLKAPAIPNIFSPNGDGVHDRWVIQYLETYPGCTVDVYNRYGSLVYHSVGYTTPWDGTVNGKPVPVGTYYYIVNPKNGRSQMSGYVDIIR